MDQIQSETPQSNPPIKKKNPIYTRVWFVFLVALVIVIGVIVFWGTTGHKIWGRMQCENVPNRHYNPYRNTCRGVYTDANEPCIQNSECTSNKCNAPHYSFYYEKDDAAKNATYDDSGYLIGKCDDHYKLEDETGLWDYSGCGIKEPITKDEVISGEYQIEYCIILEAI